MVLLSSFGKEGVNLNLLSRKVDIEDRDASSKYFSVIEFDPTFTGGKNSFTFNGSPLLKDKSEVQVECLDSKGNSLYLEQAKANETQFTDASKFVVSVHIYDETYNGAGKIVLVGTTANGESVRWIGNITIDKTVSNDAKVRFVYKPTIEVRPLLYPVVDTERATVDYPPPPVVTTATATATISSVVQSVRITGTGAGYTTATVSFDYLYSGGYGAAATAVISAGFIIAINVTNPGGGYISPPTVYITGDGTTAAIAVAVLKSQVTAVNVANGGAGYTFNPAVVFTPRNGAGAGAVAHANVVNGVVTSIVVDDGGNGYVYTPTVKLEVPNAPPAPNLNTLVNFSASFSTLAANPLPGANKNTFNPKQIDVDYRLVIADSTFVPITNGDFDAPTFPPKAFNIQMESQTMTLHITRIKQPYSTQDIPVNLTASVMVKKVLDSRTIQLSDPFYYTVGKNQFVVNITSGRCFMDYQLVLYNTAPDASKLFPISPSLSVAVKESYAEIVYRNIKCFTGYVARHKLYRKSSFYPGDFQLISDELLGPIELLSDQVTFNKFYDKMGTFYNQPHIDKYWFAETTDFDLSALTTPINSMLIDVGGFENADGRNGVILKTDTLGGTNDNVYRPYDENEYNLLSGSHYDSNFVNLRKNVLYVLGANLSLEKNAHETEAKVSFYFTSSIASMRGEKTFDPRFGLKLGEISTKDTVAVKYFTDRQYLYFTPQENYYGTLVVVPYHCSPTLADVSLKVYGDHGFSPDCNDIRIPFLVNTANEAFDIKAELLDINSTVVYSNLRTVQTFDENGESLIGKTGDGTINSTITIVQGDSITIEGQPYFPDLTTCDNTTRLVGWHVPQGDAEDGKLCYTNVSRLYISQSNYITLHSYESGVEEIAKSIAVQYDFSQGTGRKIFIDAAGTKELYP